MKIIFMNNSGFSKITAELTYVEQVKKLFDYEIWDISNMFGKRGIFQNIDEAQNIDSWDEFNSRLSAEVIKDQIIIITNMVQSAFSQIYRIIKRNKIIIIDTQKNNFMSFLERKSAFDFSIKMPLKFRIKRVINSFYPFRYFNKLIHYGGVRFDYFLSAYNFTPEEVKKFIKTHNVKYDEYIKSIKSSNPIGEKFILFIDSATYYHPVDYKKNDRNFNKTYHLKQLNAYFDSIEKKFELPVVISLHPCSVGHLNEHHFNGRKITYSITAELIQHCNFVISFFSTSLINVILSKKPSIIITSKEIENSDRLQQELSAFTLAKMCGFKIDTLDQPLLPHPIVDQIKYNNFIKKYLVNNNKKNYTNSEMLIELLRSLEH